MVPIELDAALRFVLARYPAIARPYTEPDPLGNAGGLSGAQLWRFPSGRGELAARAWPPEGPPRHSLERIHGWIQAASRVGFLAAPLAALDGRTVQEHAGRLWDVSPWLPGQPATAGPAQARAAFAGLAAVHQALAHERIFAVGGGLPDRLRETQWWLAAGFSSLERALATAEPNVTADLARQWLADARRAAPRWLEKLRDACGVSVWCQPCLRDARPAHFLFVGERLTGLVDYGAMGIDTVACDLARLLSEGCGADLPLRADGLAAYAAVRPLNERETVLIDAFEMSAALLGAGRWARWHFLDQRPFRDPAMVEQGLRKGVARLTRRLAAEVP